MEEHELYLHVEESDDDEGREEVEGEGVIHEGDGVPVLAQVVVAAGDEEALRRVVAPPQEGRHAHQGRVGPQHHDQDEGDAPGDLGPGEAFHDDVIPEG